MNSGSEMAKENSTETWRVFCAIDVPQDVRASLVAHIKELRERFPEAPASWSRPENIHLTLKFLGEIPIAKVGSFTLAVNRALEGLAAFKLGVGETGVFPTHGTPRVLWVGLDDSQGQLRKLHALLEDESAKSGFRKETRTFHPHLTVARLRRPQRGKEEARSVTARIARALALAHRGLQFPPAEIAVSELLIIRSELGNEGSKYTLISRHPLIKSDEL